MMTGLIITIVSLGFTFAVLGGVFYLVWVKLLKPMRESSKLLQTGSPARARILSVSDTGVRLNDNPQVLMTLEVTPDGGFQPAYQTQTKAVVSFVHLPQYQPGARLRVKYDPQNPMVVAVEGVDTSPAS
jgi:Protein of unknown function (DUF3592)